jgi:hypothetical protein
MAIGAALNALTTRTTIFTVLRLETATGELWLGYSGAEPGALRIELAPVYVTLRNAATQSSARYVR